MSKYHKLMNGLPVNDYRVWHIDLVTNEKRPTFRCSVIEDFITTYFTQFAKELITDKKSVEQLKPIMEVPPYNDLAVQVAFKEGYNYAVGELNSNINKALGK